MEKRVSRAEETPNSIFAADRRRSTRYCVHTPAYVSVSGSAPGTITDLAEVLNMSESGICVQFTTPMEASRLLPLCLDLSATETRIYEVGHVVWSDSTGRTGIRLPETSELYQVQLQAWLEVNTKIEVSATPGEVFCDAAPDPAVTGVGNEEFNPDVEQALSSIAQQALTLTRASGAAVALMDPDEPSEMICRAQAGTHSPEIGTRLQTGSGFSGECVRSGKAITCDDAENDPRVDRSSCRVLGVRSVLAAPVKREGHTVGVIEIFSPAPRAFTDHETAVLSRLADFVTNAVQCFEFGAANVIAIPWLGAPLRSASGELRAFETSEILSSPPSPQYKIALLASGITCLIAAAWMLTPTLARLRSPAPVGLAPSMQAGSPHDYVFKTISELTAQANRGDVGAQYELAMRYANGTDVAQDYREAKGWFLRAADQGYVAAQSKIAAAFWEGKGVPQDYSKAYFWALLAEAGGDEPSRGIVMSCAAQLSPVQIAAEQKEADQWLHSHHLGQPTW